MDLRRQLEVNTNPGPFYEAGQEGRAAPDVSPVRLIAYYLPQFHSIAENDEWWGKGFTEWTNVTKVIPRFEGHYQPRLPGDLGFYDLRQPEALRGQAVLARQYGIEGFCFHHFWFQGRRLLETPVNNLLTDRSIDIGFCVNWANENWTRSWDGAETKVLIRQNYSPEDDLAFAASLLPLFDDPRYIRINGRPFLMLYRPNRLPDAAATVARWRAFFAERGVANPYITFARGFDDDDPRKYGMDAAAGFPPHKVGWILPNIQPDLADLDMYHRGKVSSYDQLVQSGLSDTETDYRVIPGVCPGWDNEARKPNRGNTFHDATPAKYGEWLVGAGQIAKEAPTADERIVLINAWNEWAEGAYLEPDRHFGYAFLAETARSLHKLAALSGPVERQAVASPIVAQDVHSRPLFRRWTRTGFRIGARTANRVAAGLQSLSQRL